MNERIAHIALLVDDYDDAISFYTERLDFHLIEDTLLTERKRWVLVQPRGEGNCKILLAKAEGAAQKSVIGNQTGGRVFLFLYTDNFDSSFQKLVENKIEIVRPPLDQPYGKVAVFADLYGNLWDLIEPAK